VFLFFYLIFIFLFTHSLIFDAFSLIPPIYLLHAQAAAARDAERARRKAETDSMRAKYGMAKDKP
jgi:hypothetical protein